MNPTVLLCPYWILFFLIVTPFHFSLATGGNLTMTSAKIPEQITLPVVIPTSQGSDTLQIKELVLANSVITSEDINVCLPQHYRFIRTRINYGQIFKDVHTKIGIATNTVGSYGTNYPPYVNMAVRRCTPRQREGSSYCPLTAVITIGVDAARQRQRVITQWRSLDGILAEWISRWNTQEQVFHYPDPAVPIKEVNQQQKWVKGAEFDSFSITNADNVVNANVYFPRANPEIAKSLDFLEGFELEADPLGGQKIKMPIEISTPEFTNLLAHLADRMTLTSHTIQALKDEAEKKMEKGLFPSYLFPPEFLRLWTPKNESTPPGQYSKNIDRDIRMIQLLPLTTIRKHEHCDPGAGFATVAEHCYLDTLTFLPVQDQLIEYTRLKLTSHPVPKSSRHPEQAWHMVNTHELPEIYQQKIGKEIQYYTTSKPLQCFTKPIAMRRLYCVGVHDIHPLHDQCIQSILNETITDVTCEVGDTERHDTMQYVNDPTHMYELTKETNIPIDIVLTNDEETSIITRCANNKVESITIVPHAARIQAPATCEVKILNGPNITIIQPNSYVPFVQQVPVTRPNYSLREFFDRETLILRNGIQRHFHEYGYIYVLSVTSVVVIALIVLGIYLMYVKCKASTITAQLEFNALPDLPVRTASWAREGFNRARQSAAPQPHLSVTFTPRREERVIDETRLPAIIYPISSVQVPFR